MNSNESVSGESETNSVSTANELCDALIVARSRTSRVEVAGSGCLMGAVECPPHANPQWQFSPQQQDFLTFATCVPKQSVVRTCEHIPGPARLKATMPVITDRNRWAVGNIAEDTLHGSVHVYLVHYAGEAESFA
jgi:hypothetical protein